MGETCGRCGRPKGISFNDIDAYKKCLGGAPCLERAYERSQTALAAARRECDRYRSALERMTTMRHEIAEVALAALAAPAAGDARVACGDCPPHPAKEDREP